MNISQQEIMLDSLKALETAERIYIRPYARMNEFVGYLAYTRRPPPYAQYELRGPVLYNIEVNEKTNQLRIRDETRETKFVCTGDLFEPENKLLIWCQAGNLIGTVYENYAQETTGDSLNRCLFYQPVVGVTIRAEDIKFNIFCQQEYVAHIQGNEKACYVMVRFEMLTIIEKFMLTLTGLKFLYCKYQLHQHPLPTNLLHTREALTSPTNPTLENFSKGIMRIAFNGIGKQFFAEILNATTHQLEVIVHYTTDATGGGKKLFMDVFGNLLFMSKYGRETVNGEKVTSRDGCEIGFIKPSSKDNFVTSPSGCVLIQRKIDIEPGFDLAKGRKVFKFFAAGRPGDLICVIFQHVVQGNLRINFKQTASVEEKALILSCVAFLAVTYFKEMVNFLKPTVQEYPLKNQSLL